MENFAEELKKARETAGLSKQEAADALGVPVLIYHLWEKGEATPMRAARESALGVLKKQATSAKRKEAVRRALASIEQKTPENVEPDQDRGWKKYPGFGTEMSIPKWAAAFGIPRKRLWRWVCKGLTIEQVADRLGLEYSEE